ncbi:hypothetical protein [Cohnella thailandensis]|uniref:Uncharacterized protein n=1 Tax=Cohnella thailandensis TaxID=557557 RepID=A0A841SSI1_9BACL|nr:hypothetical protein [Cohnella thailandensis]MBB6633546.1 hypothetical protein [Cohnella thailandensis]MBP1974563.1 hypothetical protein [Cohnella thailandensis]
MRRRKKSRKRKRERGSVSIFFIAAAAGFVLLNGLLIDYARVAAFRKQAELSVMSGTRSVLSAYDPELYEKYGLFARGGDSADELFLRTLEGNQPTSDGQTFSLLDVKWTASAAIESRPLASHEVLRRQVLEEMKYKAPIDLTIELISRWRGVADAVKEAGSTVDRLEEMRQAYERREASLDEALEMVSEAGKLLVEPLETVIPSPVVSLNGQRSAAKASTLPDVVLMYPDYVAKRTSDENRAAAYSAAYQAWAERARQAEAAGDKFTEPPPAPTPPLYDKEISEYVDGIQQVRSQLLRLEGARKQSESRLERAAQAIEAARRTDEEMRRIAEEGSAETEDAENAGDALSPEESSFGYEANLAYEELRRSIQELVLGDEWFEEFLGEVDRQRQAGERLSQASLQMAGTIGGIPGSTGLSAQLVSEGDQLQSQAELYRSGFGESGSVVMNRRERIEEYRSTDQERRTLEEQADREWRQAEESILSLAGHDEAEPEDSKTFEQLERLYRSNLAWNSASDDSTETYEQASELGSAREEALEQSSGWLSAMSDAAVGARDRLYGSEYVVGRFVHSDPTEVREILAGQAELPASPTFQQAEYILYGFSKASSNLMAAYSEVLAARLSIRMAEGLIESARYGHPLLVLAAATLYAVRAAAQDMRSLLATDTIPLSKYVAVTTTYSDYLRLFLLMHGGSEKHWARMTAIMEQESGLSFERLYTYVSGQGTASITLWFFPGLVKTLGLSGRWGGTVNGERYEATYQADDAYQ